MKMVNLKCDECGKSFDRLKKEYTRSKNLGRKSFCNRTCQAINGNKQRDKEFYKLHCYDISQHAGCRQDEYSPFRTFLTKGKSSNIKHTNNLSLEYLKSLWEKQRGICPYSGIKMIIARNTKASNKTRSLKKASLDRIDSSKGYIEGNVEFVCLGVNLAKCNFAKEEAISFFKEIASQIGGAGGFCPRVPNIENTQQLHV